MSARSWLWRGRRWLSNSDWAPQSKDCESRRNVHSPYFPGPPQYSSRRSIRVKIEAWRYDPRRTENEERFLRGRWEWSMQLLDCG